MEGLRAALAASVGLHLAVVAALSVVPGAPEAPPPAASIVVPVEIVSAGPPRDATDEAEPADPDSPPAGAATVEPARARPAVREDAAVRSGETAPVEWRAVEAPPLPVPKPDQPPPRLERRADAPSPAKPSIEPRPSQRAGRVETEPAPEPPLPDEREPPRAGGGREETGGAAGAVGDLPPTVEEGGPAATASGRPAAAASSDVLEAYFSRLRQWLEKHKRYPRMAQARGQEGTGMLRFTVDRSGRVLSHRLDRGTGHAALDREIEAMIERAQPLPPIPQDLPQPALDLAIPVSFRLR